LGEVLVVRFVIRLSTFGFHYIFCQHSFFVLCFERGRGRVLCDTFYNIAHYNKMTTNNAVMVDANKLADEALSEYESEVPTQQLKKSPWSVGQHWPSSPELLQASFTAQDANSGVSMGDDVSPFLVGLFVGLFVGLNKTKNKYLVSAINFVECFIIILANSKDERQDFFHTFQWVAAWI
jgi:hypothetical protein